MKRALLRGVLCGVLVLCSRRAAAQTIDTTDRGAQPDPSMLSPQMLEAGRKIFHGKGTCSGCHGDKLQGGPVAPALTGPGWRHITGSFDAILDRIDNGLPGTLMVPHPGGISESQVFLVAYRIDVARHQEHL